MGLFLRAAAGCAGDLVLAAPAGATDPSGRTHVPGKIFDGYWSVVVSGAAWAAQHWRESLQVNSSSRPALRPYNGFTACTHAYIRLAQLGSFTENLWRIRHTRPESPQLDSLAGGRKIILAHLCASFGGRRLHRSWGLSSNSEPCVSGLHW